jgi:hypothetical protein
MLPLRSCTTDAAIGAITATGAGATMIAVARTIMTKAMVGAEAMVGADHRVATVESHRDGVLGHCAVARPQDAAAGAAQDTGRSPLRRASLDEPRSPAD